jgi:hypothetical protein
VQSMREVGVGGLGFFLPPPPPPPPPAPRSPRPPTTPSCPAFRALPTAPRARRSPTAALPLALAAHRPPPCPSRRRPDRAAALQLVPRPPRSEAASPGPLPAASPRPPIARRRPRRLLCAGDEPPSSRVPPGRATARSHCASGPRAISASCTRLILLISDLFNSLQIQKFV